MLQMGLIVRGLGNISNESYPAPTVQKPGNIKSELLFVIEGVQQCYIRLIRGAAGLLSEEILNTPSLYSFEFKRKRGSLTCKFLTGHES